MYSVKEQRKFDETMGIKRKEIESLDVSDEERDNLYQILDETIERYKENKLNYINNQIAFARLIENFDNIGGSLNAILSLGAEINKALPVLEKMVSEVREGGHPSDRNLPGTGPFSNN